MKLQEFNTFKFFRAYFHLPTTVKLQWVIIHEEVNQNTESRLGIRLNDNLYIDVAMRRFFSVIDSPMVKRSFLPAERHAEGENYVYTAQDERVTYPKTYIFDIYHSSWYDPSRLDETYL